MNNPLPENPGHDASQGLNREILLEKINGYLNRQIPWEAVYQWAFHGALEPGFDCLAETDPQTHDMILGLVALNDQTFLISYRRVLKDYRSILLGKKKPRLRRPEWSWGQRIDSFSRELVVDIVRCFVWMYIGLFAVASLIVNYVLIRKPEIFLHPETIRHVFDGMRPFLPNLHTLLSGVLSNQQIPLFISAIRPEHHGLTIHLLHMAFALLALLSPAFIVRGPLFPIALPFLSMGTIYYWYIDYNISVKAATIFMLGKNSSFIMVSSCIAFPASLVLARLLFETIQLQMQKKGAE